MTTESAKSTSEVDGLEKNNGVLMLASTNHRMYPRPLRAMIE